MRGALRRALLVLAVASVLVTGYGVSELVQDYWQARQQAPVDQALLERLEEQVQTDASAVPLLDAERERLTQQSLDREARSRRLGWTVLVAAALLTVAGKGWRMLGPAVHPTRARIEAEKTRDEPWEDGAAGNGAAPAQAAAGSGVAAEPFDPGPVDRMVQRLGRGADAAIPLIQAIQAHYGYLPDEALQRVCETTEVTPAQIAGTSTFYSHFRRTPMGEHLVRVCVGTACHVSGARQITEEIHRHLGIPEGDDTDPERRFTVSPVACLGCCSLAPVLMVDERTVGRLTPATACRTLDRVRGPAQGAAP